MFESAATAPLLTITSVATTTMLAAIVGRVGEPIPVRSYTIRIIFSMNVF